MRTFLSLLFVSLLLISCIQEEDNTNVKKNDYALTVGNSWVYKDYSKNSSTNKYDIDLGVVDSVSIVGIDNIQGIEYYKFRRKTTGNNTKITCCNPNGEYFYYLRQDNGRLIDDNGVVYFSFVDDDEIVIQDIEDMVKIYGELNKNETLISTEAGDFKSYLLSIYSKNSEGFISQGKDSIYYSKNIGQIYRSCSFVSNPIHIAEKRLISYNIN